MKSNSQGYESWKQARGRTEIPQGFADSVMASVRELHRHQQRFALQAVLFSVSRSRWGRLLLCSLALLTCLFRITQVVAVFVVQ